MHPAHRLTAEQDGVLSRAQALELTLSANDVGRLVRRREWASVHPGTYVDRNGPLTWRQRAWAGTLATAPSALRDASALRIVDHGPEPDDDRLPIHVGVHRDRRLTAPPGVVLHRASDFGAAALLDTSPPRQRCELAVLHRAAAARDDLRAIAVLAGARARAAARRAAGS